MTSGGYTLTLEQVTPAPGPNLIARRAVIQVRPPHGPAFTLTPERRFYPDRRQTTFKVAISRREASDLYVVLGDEQDGAGRPAWLVRAFYNPWARLISSARC